MSSKRPEIQGVNGNYNDALLLCFSSEFGLKGVQGKDGSFVVAEDWDEVSPRLRWALKLKKS